MKRFYLSILTLISLALGVTAPVFASSQYGSRVTLVESIQGASAGDRYTYFYLEDNGTRPYGTNVLPTCANGNKHWVINSIDKDIASQQIAILMMAKAQGRILHVQGTGNCSEGSSSYNHNAETVLQLWID